MKQERRKEVIIIGAGAAGLMCAASPYWQEGNGKAQPLPEGDSGGGRESTRLILESGERSGRKLLMSGGGRCNLSHEGPMRELVHAYGEGGKALRKVLYAHGNESWRRFLEARAVPTKAEEDGRVFPCSEKAEDVRRCLEEAARGNGFALCFRASFTGLERREDAWLIHSERGDYLAEKVVIATGGCSYPTSGSDGKALDLLAEALGLRLTERRPALLPFLLTDYPYGALAGMSLQAVGAALHREGQPSLVRRGDLLFTHEGFSGPGVLDLSLYGREGDRLSLNYLGTASYEEVRRSLESLEGSKGGLTPRKVAASFELPRRLAEALLTRGGASPKRLAHFLTEDSFRIRGTKGFAEAMLTAGGVSLQEVDPGSMELRRFPGLFVIGEALDVQGYSGGYNLQLCWSTAQAAAAHIAKTEGPPQSTW